MASGGPSQSDIRVAPSTASKQKHIGFFGGDLKKQIGVPKTLRNFTLQKLLPSSAKFWIPYKKVMQYKLKICFSRNSRN